MFPVARDDGMHVHKPTAAAVQFWEQIDIRLVLPVSDFASDAAETQELKWKTPQRISPMNIGGWAVVVSQVVDDNVGSSRDWEGDTPEAAKFWKE